MNKPLILAMCDVLVLSALSLSTGGFEGGGKESAAGETGIDPGVVEKLKEAVAKAERRAAEAENGRNAAEADAATAREDAKSAKEGQRKAEDEKVAATAKVVEAERRAAEAENGRNAAEADAERARKDRDNIDQKYGIPARKRQERIDRIRTVTHHVTVTFKDGGHEEFYSPIVGVDGDIYVIARYEGKVLESIKTVAVSGDKPGEKVKALAAYYLKENNNRNIVFFKMPPKSFCQKLTLGEKSDETLYFWISRENGGTKKAQLVVPGLKKVYEDYSAINPGDVLVDAGTASIVMLSLSNGYLADIVKAHGSHAFEHKVTHGDLCYWTRCMLEN